MAPEHPTADAPEQGAGAHDAGQAIVASLIRMGLVEHGHLPELQPLSGGVSSDIYLVQLASRQICVKRALPKLKVAADWRAPTERNRYEVAWMRFAASVVPQAVPEVLGADDEGLAFAMRYLEPANHPVWKLQLRDGIVDPVFASAVGRLLGALHAASAGRDDLAQQFATDANFHAIRLEPYLVASAARHPDLAEHLLALVARTAATRKALVHGDVSPKNILCGPNGPVILDAECAWFGDPAFDLAFCLNHLLLKAVWRPSTRDACADALRTMLAAYLKQVNWETAAELEQRAAGLLPALLLARIDGKSPVEYLTQEKTRDSVRRFAREQLANPASSIEPIVAAWLAWLHREAPEPER